MTELTKEEMINTNGGRRYIAVYRKDSNGKISIEWICI